MEKKAMEFIEAEISHVRGDWPRTANVENYSISKVKLSDLDRLVGCLINRGLNGSLLEIRDIKSNCSFRFQKYISGENIFGIIGLFNFIYGSEELRKFQIYCIEAGLALVGQGDSQPAEEGGEFQVDFEKRTQVAYKALAHLVSKVEELPKNAKFNVELLGISQWNETISSPGQIPASREVGLSLARDLIRKKTGAGPYGNFVFIFLCFCQLFGVLGLLVALIIRSDGIFSFQLLQSGFVLDIPLWDAISLLLVLLGFFAVFSPAYWRISTLEREESTTPVPRRAGAMLRHFFSKPINWVTLGILPLVAFTWILELQ